MMSEQNKNKLIRSSAAEFLTFTADDKRKVDIFGNDTKTMVEVNV
jgi:hypothetical protein